MENIQVNALTGIITILGVLFALFEYQRRSQVEKEIVLRSMRALLDSISHWASRGDDGYPQSPNPAQQRRFMEIYDHIFSMNHEPLNQSLLASGSVDFGSEFYDAVAKMNQHILRIHSLKENRELIINSQPDLALELHKKIRAWDARARQENFSITEFLEHLPERERLFAEILYTRYKELHCTIIGTYNSDGLKDNYNKVNRMIREEENKVNKVTYKKVLWWLFVLIVFIAITKIIDVTYLNDKITFPENFLFSVSLVSLLITNRAV